LQVVPGGVFAGKLAGEWKSLNDTDNRTFYGVICIAAALGIPVRSPIAFRTIETADTGRIFSELSTGRMRGLIEWYDQEFVRPRHRVVGEQTLQKCMSPEELFQISERLAGALSPYVNRSTLMVRSPEARLAAELMNIDGLVVQALGERAEAWFQGLERDWGWNSRYWEQRALAAMKARHYPRARDFAEQAVGAENHPFPKTTCALVNLASIEHDENLERQECESLFSEAITLLDEAIYSWRTRRWRDAHSYHVLFMHAVRVSRKLFGGIEADLRGKLESHGADVERLFSRDPEISKALSTLKEEGLQWR